LDEEAYARLGAVTSMLADGLSAAASEAGVPVSVQHVPGLLTPFFSSRPVERYSQAAACDLERYGIWCRALLERGVYPPASQFEAWFPSLAHGEAEVERTIEAARGAFAEVAAT
jgi:glutamate-1-semialdehyde 2,1-aminomutase